MAVYDRWHRAPRDGDEPCKCSRGKRKLYPSAVHEQGDRWQVRWYDDEGAQRKRNFRLREGPSPDLHADAFDAKVRRELDTGDYTDPATARVTFREYAEQHRRSRAVDDVSAAKTETGLRLHAYPVIGHHSLLKLARQPSLTQAWIRGLEGSLAASSAAQLVTDVSGVFIAAMDDGLIGRNPVRAASVTRPRPPQRKARAWTAERVSAMAAALPDRYALLPVLGAGTGMRQGELFALAVDDITFLGRDPKIRVARQVKIVAGRLCFALPKRDKTRELPLAPEVAEALARHMELFAPAAVTLPWHEPRNRQKHGKPVTIRLVITGARGGAVRREPFNRNYWHPAQEAAGVTPERKRGEKRAPAREEGMHALRHTFASVQLGAGVDVVSVAAWMGDTPAVMLATYAHFMPGREGSGRAAVSAFLGRQDDQAARGSASMS